MAYTKGAPYKNEFYVGDEVSVSTVAGNASSRARIANYDGHGMYFEDEETGKLFFISYAAGLMLGPAYDYE